MEGFSNSRKTVFYIRQSAVLSSDEGKPKAWRELVFYNWMKADGKSVKLVVSGFDNYSKKRRLKPSGDFRQDVTTLPFIPYRKTHSILRVVDAWVFSISLFMFLYRRVRSGDVILVSMPTPESAMISSIVARIKNVKVICDIRDAWPDNYTKGGLTANFTLYVSLMNKLTFRLCNHFFWMSDGLKQNFARKGLGCRQGVVHVTLPGVLEQSEVLESSSEAVLDAYLRPFQHVFEKPTLVFFGTLNSQFDLSSISGALRRGKAASEVNFVIAGDGERREEFEDAFEGCENVFFVGHVPFVVTRRLSELASGYFLFYREPATFENHLTNKIREFAACPRPIIHNLSDNIFTVDDDSFQVGLSVEAHEFDDLCERIIKNNTSSFAIGDLGRLAQRCSVEVVRGELLSHV